MTFTQLQQTIYASVKPIVKIYIIIACGFVLGRLNILTTQTCKHISGTVVLVLLPALIFAKIVANIGIEDIKQVGIIVLVSCVLYFVGGILSLLTYYTTKVPKHWFGGCVSAGLFPNVAELPIAYLSTFTIFDDDEVEKGLSYVVMFLSAYCIVQFNFGAIMLIEEDFEVEKREMEMVSGTKQETTEQVISRTSSLQSHRSHMSNLELRRAQTQDIDDLISSYSIEGVMEQQKPQREKKFSVFGFLKFFVLNLQRTMSLALIVSLICALIPWLRALFVTTPSHNVHTAPDGDPPLSFIMDMAAYLADACVPLGILVLGATLSRLSLKGTPIQFWYTPILLTFIRLVLLPIIGILFTNRLHKIGWFEGDRILHFVCAISFGLPCATSLIYLTAACAEKEGPQMKYLAAVYVVQYAVLVVSLPILSTWTVMKSLDPE